MGDKGYSGSLISWTCRFRLVGISFNELIGRGGAEVLGGKSVRARRSRFPCAMRLEERAQGSFTRQFTLITQYPIAAPSISEAREVEVN